MLRVGFGITQRFRPIPPRHVFVLSTLLHGLAALTLLSPMMIAYDLRTVMIVILGLNLWRQWRRGRDSVVEVVWHAPDHWQLRDIHDSVASGQLLSTSVILPWLAVLRFRLPSGYRHTLMILPWEHQRQALRRLYVALR